MDYSPVRHQHGAVFLTCMSFKTRMIMAVGVEGGDEMAGEGREVVTFKKGCIRL